MPTMPKLNEQVEGTCQICERDPLPHETYGPREWQWDFTNVCPTCWDWIFSDIEDLDEE